MKKLFLFLLSLILILTEDQQCDKGYKLNNGECKPINEQCKGGKMIGKRCTCFQGYKLQGDKCLKDIKCPPGQKKVRGRCVPDKCPLGQYKVRNMCVYKCPPWSSIT